MINEMRVMDAEGEEVIELTDINSMDELDARWGQEEQHVMEVLWDSPFFGTPADEYEKQHGLPVQEPTAELTYDEWMAGARAWAQDIVDNQD